MSELKAGDLVRMSRVVRLTSGRKYSSLWGKYVYECVDEKSNQRFSLDDSGTLKLELLHRQQQKPKVGEIIDGVRFRNTMWKRGSVFRDTRGEEVFSVKYDGTIGSTLEPEGYEFNEFDACDQLEVIYLP